MSEPRFDIVRLAAGVCLAALCLSGPAAGQEEVQTAPNAGVTPLGSESEVTRTAAGLFDVHVRDAPLIDALRMLGVQARRNISASVGAEQRITTDLYGVTFDEALGGLLRLSGFTWFEDGKFVYVCAPEQRKRLSAPDRDLQIRLFELNYITAVDAGAVVSKLLSENGMLVSTAPAPVRGVALTADDFDQALDQGLGGKSRAVGEFLLIRDRPDVIEQIAQVLIRLDARPRQVMIEAVILRARLDETNALGVDFNALAGIDFRTVAATSLGGTSVTTGFIPDRAFDSELGAVVSDVSGNIPMGGLTFGVMANNVGAFVRALENVIDLTIVANPKILAVNEQPARVIVGREDGYLTTTVTETAAIQTVEFIQTGTQILFRPFITSDGYVRMDIHPEDSNGGLTPDNLPFKDTTEVTTNVLVKDGHTLVIGGLFREVTTSNVQQIPWLGNLPLIGGLFRGKVDSALREEVIVLITPHIIDIDADDGRGEWALEEVERRRTLAHRGLMPWGRERLAQAHYRWALEHVRNERLKAAIWDLDLALSIHPRFIEASRLRDRLTHSPTREPDNSVIRRILRRIANEQASGDAADATSTQEDEP